MRMRWAAAAALVASTLAPLVGASAQDQRHPNRDIFEYRVVDHVLQPGSSYPEGSERGAWDCFDGQTRIAVLCAYATRPMNAYRFIFRRDVAKLRHIKDSTITGGLY